MFVAGEVKLRVQDPYSLNINSVPATVVDPRKYTMPSNAVLRGLLSNVDTQEDRWLRAKTKGSENTQVEEG